MLGRAAEVLGGEEQARQWLTSPNTLFDGRAPIDYAETAEGMALVLDVLGRIEYGVFS
ncbi:MbcA/ParS/Xre antitoxin family protein [Solidesulfovibrio carbinoliphilus]|uniref:MbcA/ParS/Xre antitoxin family protein n=1 Tax=Solidesulfovibrio carbinoliphilus TaxID=345370 RepID=UPI0002FC643E|nr:MbcA/ParS/Xre antitoxin family protein [Solidesulfovibrio carbinoliphilus]